MFNKVLVFGGLALAAILIVENMVGWAPAYLFIDRGSTAWMLSMTSIIIGIAIGFWIKGLMTKNLDEYDEDLNF
mgnify:FL=1